MNRDRFVVVNRAGLQHPNLAPTIHRTEAERFAKQCNHPRVVGGPYSVVKINKETP